MLIFLVPGYGIPGGDICADGNYNAYLHAVLAMAFDVLSADPHASLTIIFSGGPTDMVAPYERTEAGEMARWFRAKLARDVFAGIRGRIEIRLEERALSTFDNILRFREMGIGLASGDRDVIFCEQTRRGRVLSLVSRILITERADFKVHPVEFDQTDNRFRDPAFIRMREDAERKVAVRALSSEEDLAACRALYERRIAKLREAGPGQAHVDAVHAWWKTELAAFVDGRGGS
jgi:hypothetical protein